MCIDYSHYGHVPVAGKLLFIKYGNTKYLHKIDCVEYTEEDGKKLAYVHFEHAGFYFTDPDYIVEVDESEVAKCFGNCYKWKE